MIRADLYLPGNTWLHRADARVKLLLVATGPLLLLLYQNLILALAGLLALGALLASAAWAGTNCGRRCCRFYRSA